MTITTTQFARQQQTSLAIARELRRNGGLPITNVGREWFWKFTSVIQPLIRNINHRTNLKIIWDEAQRLDNQFNKEIPIASRNPVVTIDCRTA